MTTDESQGNIAREEMKALFLKHRGKVPTTGQDHVRYNQLKQTMIEAFGEERVAGVIAEIKMLATER